MRGLKQFTLTEFILNLRDPLMVFWSLAFPTLWLLLMVIIVPAIPGFVREGLSKASSYLPSAISLVILSASFIGVPMTLTNYRETAVLKRFRVTPVKILTLVSSFSISQFAFVAMGIIILLVIGILIFNVHILGSWLAFVGVTFFGMLTFLAIGSAIGSIAGSFRTANIVIWTAFTPILILSDLFMPIALLPTWLQPIARGLPLTVLNTVLKDIVYGVPVGDLWRLVVLAGWLVVAIFITVRFFRWE